MAVGPSNSEAAALLFYREKTTVLPCRTFIKRVKVKWITPSRRKKVKKKKEEEEKEKRSPSNILKVQVEMCVCVLHVHA